MFVKLPISSHEWRCIDENKNHCPQLQVSRFGTVWSCKLFSKQGGPKGQWEDLEERDGCLVKHPECLANGEKG